MVAASSPTNSLNVRQRLLDIVAVLGVSGFVALMTQRWTGIHLDSMFYATLALNGDEVTDRAVIDSYYWTRLGYIVPVRALTLSLGPWAGFEVWRYVLIVGVVSGLYILSTRFTPRTFAIPLVAMLSLNSVVMTYLGNSYLTGAVLAGTSVAMAVAFFPGWKFHAIAGMIVGWLAMVNPPGALLALTVWCAIRIHRGFRWRASVLAACSAVAVFGSFLLCGLVVFPGLSWFGTYAEWNAKLNYSDFASDSPVWLQDISLLVTLMALVIALGAWLQNRQEKSSQLALIISATSIGFMLTFSPLMGGIAMEAPMYQAMLWPPALASVGLVVAGRLAKQRPARSLTTLAFILGVGAVIVAGHFTGFLTMFWGVVLAVMSATLMLLAIGLQPRLSVNQGVSALLIGLIVVLSGAQVLQNSRRTIGLYPTTPYSWAFVANPIEMKMRESVNAESWLIANTSRQDQILNWVGGDWVGGDRELYMLAAMQLWGENRVTLNQTMDESDRQRLRSLKPSVVQMVAPEMDQIIRFWASLPKETQPTGPVCYDFPWPAPTFPVGHSCLTTLTWPEN